MFTVSTAVVLPAARKTSLGWGKWVSPAVPGGTSEPGTNLRNLHNLWLFASSNSIILPNQSPDPLEWQRTQSYCSYCSPIKEKDLYWWSSSTTFTPHLNAHSLLASLWPVLSSFFTADILPALPDGWFPKTMTREDQSGLGHTQIGLYRREKDLHCPLQRKEEIINHRCCMGWEESIQT